MKVLVGFVMIILVAIAGWVLLRKRDTKESFMPSLTYKVDKVYDKDNPTGALTGAPTGNNYVSVPGQFQSIIPPRFGMLNGAVVSLPTKNDNRIESFDKNSMAFDPDSPLQQGILDSEGNIIQPVVYDRIMYANRRSKLLEGSDFIRGDLPIFPQNLGWFSPSVQPHIDLRRGIVDSYDKDTSDQLQKLQMVSKGKLGKAFEGEMVKPNTLMPSYGTFIDPSVGDVEIVNFV